MTDDELQATHAQLRTVAFQPQTLTSYLNSGTEKTSVKKSSTAMSDVETQHLLDEFS